MTTRIGLFLALLAVIFSCAYGVGRAVVTTGPQGGTGGGSTMRMGSRP